VTVLAISILAVATALGVLLLWVRSRRHAGINLADISSRIQSVDLEAFQILVDPEEEQYLRDSLPTTDFRPVQRERMKAALDYVRALSQNGTLLLQLGQSAKASSDPRLAEAGQHIVDNAVRLRLYTLRVRARLYVKIAFPTAKLEPARVVNEYQEARNWAALLARLQHPAGQTVVAKAL
jgi:hypothetical protein